MNERSSGQPSGNRAPSLEHPDDLAEREAVRRVLVQVRQAQGLSVAQVAKAVGCEDAMVYHLEDMDLSSYYLRFGTLFSWAAALNMAYAVEIDSLGLTVGPWLESEQAKSVMATMGTHRISTGWQTIEIAARMGISDSTVRDLEKSPNPRISTAQRYARALGGRLLLRPRILRPLH